MKQSGSSLLTAMVCASLAAMTMLAPRLTADTVVYYDEFDGDGTATNTNIGNGLHSYLLNKSGSWTDTGAGDLTYSGSAGGSFAGFITTNTAPFSVDNGFTLEVGYYAEVDNFGFGLMSSSVTDGNLAALGPWGTPFADGGYANVYGIGWSLNNRSATANEGLLFQQSTTTTTNVTELYTGITGFNSGSNIFNLTVLPSGSWTLSLTNLGTGASAVSSGTTNFSLVNDYRFVVVGYTATGGSFLDYVALTAIPEPSAWMLVLGGLGLLVMQRRLLRRR